MINDHGGIYIYMDYYKEIVDYELSLLEQTGNTYNADEVIQQLFDKITKSDNWTIVKSIEKNGTDQIKEYITSQVNNCKFIKCQ